MASATVGKLNVVLNAVTGPFTAGLQKAQSGVRSFSAGINRAASGLAGFLGLAIGGGFVTASIKAFAEEEAALNRLAASLALLGANTPQAIMRFQEFAAGIQKITTVADDQVIAMGAMGAAIGKLSGQELERAVIAAIGLSKAFGIDLNAAMLLVSKAAAGNTATLGRYGIVLDSTMTDSEKFNAVLALGAAQFSIAEAEVNTTSGRLAQLKNVLGDVMEQIGAALVPALQTLTTWLNAVFVEFQFMERITQSVGVAWSALGTAMSAAIFGVAFAVKALMEALNVFGIVSDETLAKVQAFATGAQEAMQEAAARTAEKFKDLATIGEVQRQSQINVAAAAREAADAYDEEAESIRALQAAADEAQKHLDDLTREAERVFRETRTPLEKYEETLRQLQELLEHDLISPETFQRAVKQAKDELDRLTKGEITADVAEVAKPERAGQFGEVRLSQIAIDAISPQQSMLLTLNQRMVALLKQIEENQGRPIEVAFN